MKDLPEEVQKEITFLSENRTDVNIPNIVYICLLIYSKEDVSGESKWSINIFYKRFPYLLKWDIMSKKVSDQISDMLSSCEESM